MNEQLPQAVFSDASVVLNCPICAEEMVINDGHKVWLYLFELGESTVLACDNGHTARIPDLVSTMIRLKQDEGQRYSTLHE